MAGEGWVATILMRKFHYFRDGMALCGKWMYTGEAHSDDGIKKTDELCAECWRRRAKEKECA